MQLNKTTYLITLILFFTTVGLSAQPFQTRSTKIDTFQINLDNLYRLKAISIIPESDVVTLRGSVLLDGEYKISYLTNTLTLSDTLSYSIFDTLFVKYQMLNIPLNREYKIREVKYSISKETNDTVRTITNENILSTKYLFGDISNSGTLIRGFTVGTNNDFTINSGLRLQLRGKLSKDIEIVAALTDQSSPIQPEGNTERLEELDKVFIQLQHPNAVATFGDYTFSSKIGEFGNTNKKLQGLEGRFKFKNYEGGIAFANLRGKFHTNSFSGIDGVQGPYRLTGSNNERNIIVIAGSEKVYLDGIELNRGEANDYIIEYSNAEIKFTPKKIITSASRVIVDFEYTDRNYERNFFAANAKSSIFDNKLNVAFSFTNEADDQDAPIDFLLSENEKEILSLAGDDKLQAVKSGVRLASEDTTGLSKGVYAKIDTLINNDTFSYYKYLPGDSTALYNATFTFVGSGKGDYKKRNRGEYYFAGINEGEYSPIVFVPLPSLNQNASVLIQANPFENFNVSVELTGSRNDLNRLSNLDDENNNGFARNIKLDYQVNEISLLGLNLDEIKVNARERFIDKNFKSNNRLNEVEFDRNYGILDNNDSEETLREFGFEISPGRSFKVSANYGSLKKGSAFSSERFVNSISLNKNDNLFFSIKNDFVKSFNADVRTDWNKFNASGNYQFNIFKPGIDILYEKRKVKFQKHDSLFANSYLYKEIAPSITAKPLDGLSLFYQYSHRTEHSAIAGEMIDESTAKANTISLEYSGIREVRSNLSIAFREKKYSNEFKLKGLTNNQTVLVRSQSKFNLFKSGFTGNLFYKASTEKAAKLERIFLRVPVGSGQFRYLGDLNDNGLFDEFEFEPDLIQGDYIKTTLPTEELFPVIDLSLNARMKIDFNKLMSNNNSFLKKMLSPLSTETSFRISENSTEEDIQKIYFLNMSKFLNDSTTIRGSQEFQQDVFIFGNRPDLSFRFRYNQRKTLNQFSGGTEQGYYRERSLRIRTKLIYELSLQTLATILDDQITASSFSNRARIVNKKEIEFDFNYRPQRNVEVSFKVATGTIEDRYPVNNTIIDFNQQSISMNYKFSGQGLLRTEIERTEISANTTENFIPYEVTNGDRIGKNYQWRLTFDYNLLDNLQASVNYFGRIRGNSNAIHTLRGEVKLFF